MTTIYTVGHSRHTAEHFAKLLGDQQIATLVDVRSHPASRAPQFGKAALAQMLGTKAIEYVFTPPGAVQGRRRRRAKRVSRPVIAGAPLAARPFA